MSDLLREKGYWVQSYTDAHSGLKAVEDLIPDLVLLDTRLPVLSGYDVCKKIKSREKTSVKVILYTAHADIVNLKAAKAAGADDFISKTDDFSNIVSKVEQLTGAAL